MASLLGQLFKQLTISGVQSLKRGRNSIHTLRTGLTFPLTASCRNTSTFNASRSIFHRNQSIFSMNGMPLLNSTSQKSVLQTGDLLIHPVRRRVNCCPQTGGPRTNNEVVERMYRLNNGMWVHTRMGRAKKLWKKTNRRKKRLQEHWTVNLRRAQKFDKMVNKYYKIPKYFENDPYKHYHSRKNLPNFSFSKKKFYP